MAYDSPDEWLKGGKGSPAYFKRGDQYGKKLVGKIVKVSVQQERDFKTSDLKFYNDGNPIQQLVIELQTEYRDAADPDDKGLRRTFLKNRHKPALIKAVQAGGGEVLQVGAIFTQEYTGDTDNDDPKMNPSRDYTFTYVSPANVALLAGAAPNAEKPADAPKAETSAVSNADAAKAALANLSAAEIAALLGNK